LTFLKVIVEKRPYANLFEPFQGVDLAVPGTKGHRRFGLIPDLGRLRGFFFSGIL
jgi:hypothetical protein